MRLYSIVDSEWTEFSRDFLSILFVSPIAKRNKLTRGDRRAYFFLAKSFLSLAGVSVSGYSVKFKRNVQPSR